MPASAMFVSVSTVAPCAQCVERTVRGVMGEHEGIGVREVGSGVDDALHDGLFERRNVRPPSSSVMISKLRRSMSPGAISLESI